MSHVADIVRAPSKGDGHMLERVKQMHWFYGTQLDTMKEHELAILSWHET